MNNDVVARFAYFISKLSCMTLGVDGSCGIWISGDFNGDYLGVCIDCSDKFWFATGDNEGFGSMEDLGLFIQITYWFLDQDYLNDEWYKQHYPTLENYIEQGDWIISEETENLMDRWLGLSYCMVKRGHEVHPYYWEQVPEWLQHKLKKMGVEAHPYNKKEEK